MSQGLRQGMSLLWYQVNSRWSQEDGVRSWEARGAVGRKGCLGGFGFSEKGRRQYGVGGGGGGGQRIPSTINMRNGYADEVVK